MPRYLSGLLIGALLPLLAVALLSLWWVHATASAGQAPVTVAVTASVPAFTPRVALVGARQEIVFTNSSGQDLRLTTTAHSPAQFSLVVPAGGRAHLSLTQPGLYHFYDAASARVVDYQAMNDVVDALPSASNPNLPLQGWIIVPGAGTIPPDNRINVPYLHDLFMQHAVVIRVGGSVVIHNYDTDAHNIVTDPADPTGAAFELLGQNGEPALHGAERRITFTKPGLYHIYCSIHTRSVGQVGQWQVIVPRDSNASGYADRDPMEAWIEVLP